MNAKYRLGSLTIEAIDTFVRVTVSNFGGIGAKDIVAVTKKQFPSAADVADLISTIRGYWPDSAVLQACGRAANDARNNETVLAI